MADIAVQTVLYGNSLHTVGRLMAAVAAAGAQCRPSAVHLHLGDCTPAGHGGGAELEDLARQPPAEGLATVTYTAFGANLGHGVAEGRLAAAHDAAVLVLLNPDTHLAPSALRRLVAALEDPCTGAAEARQVPLENPKLADARTGATPWATGCMLALRREAFDAVGGFDPAYFLHDDDVDLSWRLRRAGWGIRYVPGAVVFHQRGIDPSGYAESQPTEAVMMRVGELVLAGRAGRDDLVERRLADATAAGTWPDDEAADRYRAQRAEGRLPAPFGGAAAPGVLLDRGLRRF